MLLQLLLLSLLSLSLNSSFPPVGVDMVNTECGLSLGPDAIATTAEANVVGSKLRVWEGLDSRVNFAGSGGAGGEKKWVAVAKELPAIKVLH